MSDSIAKNTSDDFIDRHFVYTKIPEMYRNASLNEAVKHLASKSSVSVLKDFVSMSGKTKNLFFTGPNGCGKTYTGCALLIHLTGKRYQSLYTTSYRIMQEMRREQPWAVPRKYFQAYVLFIDEFGKEADDHKRTVSATEDLLDYRISSGRYTIIAANASVSQLEETRGPTIVSRLIGHFTPVKFREEDIRFSDEFRSLHTVSQQ